GHPLPAEADHRRCQDAEAPRGGTAVLLRPPDHQRRRRGPELPHPSHPGIGPRLPQPRAFQDLDLLPPRWTAALPGYAMTHGLSGSAHKSGRRVAGAGTFRDAVRSTSHRVVYALGLNLVVVTLRVIPPWGDMPIAVPVNARLHKKKDPTTTVEHAAQMLAELADWLPDRQLHLCADGAYACLARAHPPMPRRPPRLPPRPAAPPSPRRRLRLPGRRRPGRHAPDQPAATRRRPPPRRPATHRAPRPAKNQRRPAPRPTRTRREGPPPRLGQGDHERAWPRRRQAHPPPGRALVQRQPQRAGPPRHRPRPGRCRTRRLLRHHRSVRQRCRHRRPLRRTLVHRGLLPRRQTRPRR